MDSMTNRFDDESKRSEVSLDDRSPRASHLPHVCPELGQADDAIPVPDTKRKRHTEREWRQHKMYVLPRNTKQRSVGGCVSLASITHAIMQILPLVSRLY